jgi:RecQ-mediated genome instability protein 1
MAATAQRDPQLAIQIISTLLTRHSLPVSPPWLTVLLHSQLSLPSPPPLPALTQTTLFRLLASDFTTSLSTENATYLLPVDVADVRVKERRLGGSAGASVPLQVLDVRDMGRSIMDEVESIERIERGETQRGREINRVVPAEAMSDGTAPVISSSSASSGPHKLLLQDARGTRIWGMELRPIEGVKVGMSIGTKLLVKGGVVARGMLLLEPGGTKVLGGKIEGLDKPWKEGRKARLVAELGSRGAEG